MPWAIILSWIFADMSSIKVVQMTASIGVHEDGQLIKSDVEVLELAARH
jgi:hypothetical protein